MNIVVLSFQCIWDRWVKIVDLGEACMSVCARNKSLKRNEKKVAETSDFLSLISGCCCSNTSVKSSHSPGSNICINTSVIYWHWTQQEHLTFNIYNYGDDDNDIYTLIFFVLLIGFCLHMNKIAKRIVPQIQSVYRFSMQNYFFNGISTFMII